MTFDITAQKERQEFAMMCSTLQAYQVAFTVERDGDLAIIKIATGA